jgi:hypothetical protein
MQNNLLDPRDNFKAAAPFIPPGFLTIIYGPSGPIHADMTADDLAALGWPVTISELDYVAHVLPPTVSVGVLS